MKCIRCGLCCYMNRDFRLEQKVFSNPCKHLIHENGYPTCSIYEDRPEQCRKYFCWDFPEAIGGCREA